MYPCITDVSGDRSHLDWGVVFVVATKGSDGCYKVLHNSFKRCGWVGGADNVPYDCRAARVKRHIKSRLALNDTISVKND